MWRGHEGRVLTQDKLERRASGRRHYNSVRQFRAQYRRMQVARLTGAGSCVARCSIHTWMTECDDSHTTHHIQCGHVAGLAPDGTYICAYHLVKCWTCRHCHMLLPRETDAWCSAACQAADAAQSERG